MINYVYTPNLPEKKVKTVIAGKMPENVRNAMEKCGIKVLNIEENILLSKPVSSHADLQCVHLGENRIIINDCLKSLNKELLNLGFEVSFFSFKNYKYPFDCAVNAAFIGKNVICKYDILDEKLKEHFKSNKYNIINVKQGYSKCSVCVVNEYSVITEDESIKNACEKSNIDVLLIKKGYVSLSGYDYGFIGGASFKSDKKTLCFTGKIENHPDFDRIKSFLTNKGVNYLSLGECELTDIGSVLPIIQ